MVIVKYGGKCKTGVQEEWEDNRASGITSLWKKLQIWFGTSASLLSGKMFIHGNFRYSFELSVIFIRADFHYAFEFRVLEHLVVILAKFF